jgi:hypothetical protein
LHESLCLDEATMVWSSGRAVRRSELFVRRGANLWTPLNSNHYGPERIRTVFTHNLWREYGIRDAVEGDDPTFATVSVWCRRELWSVEFRLPNAPGLWITSDAIGARELLRMRDVPKDKTRREALKNWVCEHWRQNRRGRKHSFPEKVPGSYSNGKARDQAAQIVGVNPNYVTDAKRIKEEDPELAKRASGGDKKSKAAREEQKSVPEIFPEPIGNGEAGGTCGDDQHARVNSAT